MRNCLRGSPCCELEVQLAASETRICLSSSSAGTAAVQRPWQLQKMRTLPPLLRSAASTSRAGTAQLLVPSVTDFQAPNDWFVYGDLHLILATPTLVLLSLSPPLQTAAPLQKRAAYAFVAFIVAVGVAQSYVWDAYGAGLGLWEFNPAKCTVRDSLPLPLEEVLWLFHHVLKTALYQLKAFELVPADTSRGAPSGALVDGLSAALGAATLFANATLQSPTMGPTDGPNFPPAGPASNLMPPPPGR